MPVLTDPDSRQTQWAEDLDTLARTMEVLIVLAAGNHALDEATTGEKQSLS